MFLFNSCCFVSFELLLCDSLVIFSNHFDEHRPPGLALFGREGTPLPSPLLLANFHLFSTITLPSPTKDTAPLPIPK